jgi:hypothetical protein
MTRALALLAVLALAGCTGLGEITGQRRAMNDAQAEATLAATCDISIGAFYRLALHEREAVRVLCGGTMPEQLRAF